MNIRTKLILMLAVPLLALAVVAALGFRTQNTESEINEDAQDSVETIANLDELWQNLAAERLAVLGEGSGGDADFTELTDTTNATLDAIAAGGDARGWTAAGLAIEALPADRGSDGSIEAFDQYSNALDILEEEIAEQSLAGLESNSVLTIVAMEEARSASRQQEEAWLRLLILDDLNPASARSLTATFSSASAARENVAEIRLSDGSQPFIEPVRSPVAARLGTIEALVQSRIASTEGQTLDPNFVDDAIASLPSLNLVDSLKESRGEWSAASLVSQTEIRGDVQESFDSIDDARSLTLLLALLGGLLLFSLLFVIGRSIVGPLGRLMENADTMTHERLPAAVAQLRTVGASDEEVELAPIPKEADDEIGTIVEAFNDMQVSALKVATDQARSRRNVAEMFVSLGRRNQQLNHRMITMISDLERDEQDPETLRGLYQLDHLATRMRRNAESLLVLAGNRSPRQWSQPVPFDDVVRSSLAEVEYFERIEIGHLPEVQMSGAVVADITHMLAELLDNATQFSDPTTSVHISATETHSAIELQIQDEGFGIGDDDLIVLNERVTNPPELDEAPSRLLGLFVVGRLAQQHEVYVQLRSQPGEGTVVTATIPKTLFPTDAGENPIDVSSSEELNSDNAADFFGGAAAATAAPELDDASIDTEDDPIAAPIAEIDEDDDVTADAEPIEAASEDLDIDPIEEPIASTEIDTDEAAEVEASAEVEDPSQDPEVSEESWPLTKLDPLPTREATPMEAVQRTTESADEAPAPEASAPEDDIASPAVAKAAPAPLPERPSSEAAAPAAEAQTTQTLPSRPVVEAETDSFGGLPTRMPQAAMEDVTSAPTVLPLDLPEVDESEQDAGSVSFGHFAKGVAAGLDDVDENSEEGENS